jgi:hypothetical protein
VPDSTEITLRYLGPDVDDGSIGVDDLLAALNGFSSAFYKVSERESANQQQRIKVTGISQSSANIHLSISDLIQAHPDASKAVGTALLGGVAYVGKKIVDVVVEKISGVAKAKKHIQNGPYTTEITGNDNRIIIINGVGAQLPIEKDVFELLQDGGLDADLDRLTSPLREDAVIHCL